MEWVLVPVAAMVASLLTLFTGFGLGTLLLPVFAAFFPLSVAIAMTAVVHLLNNLFKLALMGARADRRVLFRFGMAAIVGALAGSLTLLLVGEADPIATYAIGGVQARVAWIGVIVGLAIAAFGLLDLLPLGERLALRPPLMPLGGFVSGFFGGLSGHQGALRSAFLIRSGLKPEVFAATGAVIACMVDLTRLGAYAMKMDAAAIRENSALIAVASLAAFTGAVLGQRLIRKATVRSLRWTVAAALIAFGLAMAAGLV